MLSAFVSATFLFHCLATSYRYRYRTYCWENYCFTCFMFVTGVTILKWWVLYFFMYFIWSHDFHMSLYLREEAQGPDFKTIKGNGISPLPVEVWVTVISSLTSLQPVSRYKLKSKQLNAAFKIFSCSPCFEINSHHRLFFFTFVVSQCKLKYTFKMLLYAFPAFSNKLCLFFRLRMTEFYYLLLQNSVGFRWTLFNLVTSFFSPDLKFFAHQWLSVGMAWCRDRRREPFVAVSGL